MARPIGTTNRQNRRVRQSRGSASRHFAPVSPPPGRLGVSEYLVGTTRYAIFGLIVLLACGDRSLPRQATEPIAQQTPPTKQGITIEQQEALDRYRRIITNERNVPATRRDMADGLLKSDLPGRIDLIVELLATSSAAGASTAMCEAIASIGATRPDLIDARLAEPLLELLDSDGFQLASKASAALAVFQDGGVERKLARRAADENRPLESRFAAIATLSLNTNRRDVVAALIELASQPNAAIANRVFQALRSASRIDYGPDGSAWRAWWRQKQELTNEQWLQDRLDLMVQRLRSQNTTIDRLRRQAEAHRSRVAGRFDELLRKLYQATSQQPQREALLQRWLADTAVEFRISALNLVRERISEGEIPADDIREDIKNCLADDSTAVRMAALEIIGNLKDPDDASSVLALLPDAQEPAVRETILRVLGRLENPIAVEVLVEELNDPEADSGCVREAARALGALGQQPLDDVSLIQSAIGPLRERFQEVPPGNPRLKEALLDAMARIGDPAFTPEFVANLSEESPQLVLAAIRGIRNARVSAQIDRLRAHLTHTDPRVRQFAAEAVGQLGTGEADLEALITRLDPNSEPSQNVRNAAWDGFRAVLSLKPPSVRLQWVDRLESLPDRRILLLGELIADWAANNASSPDLIDARERIVDILFGQSRYAESISHLQKLREPYIASGDPRAHSYGVRLVTASLMSQRTDRIGELITELAATADDDAKDELLGSLLGFLSADHARGEAQTVTQLAEILRALPEELLGRERTDRLKTTLDSLAKTSADDHTTGTSDPP